MASCRKFGLELDLFPFISIGRLGLATLAVTAIAGACLLPSPAHAAGSDRGITRTPVEATRNFDPSRKQRGPSPSPRLPELAPDSFSSPADGGQSFDLQSVEIEGATALSQDQLAPAYRDYIGRSITTADLGAIAERITAIYQKAGFSLSRAIIPPQDIENGSVRVTVLEGYIDDIALEGSHAQDFGARKLLAPLLGERPLRQETLERYMLLVDDTPGVQIADTALEEIGQTTGRYRLVVTLETWRLFLSTGLDNRGSSAIGRAQGYVAPAVNSIGIAGDSLDLALSSVPDQTQELRFARLGYGAPVGNNGARISGNVTYGQIWPGDERHHFEDYTETVRLELKGTIVPLRTRDASAWVSLSGDVDDVRERDDFGVISDDHVRALTLTTDVELRDRFSGSNYVTLGVRRGLTIFGASERSDDWLSKADGSGDFTVADIQYSRYQKISDTWSFNFSAAAQLASTALLATEEYYLGGAAFGRAYDGGAVSGDNALAGSFELRYDQSVERAFLKGYQLYAFADHGVVWDFRPASDERFQLTSAGGGVRLFLPDDLQGSLELAVPVDRSSYVSDARDVSIYFSLSKALKACPAELTMRCPSQ